MLVARLAFVDGPNIAQAAAATNNGIIRAVESEAVAENVMSVIHNQMVTYTFTNAVSQSTIASVRAEAASAIAEVRAETIATKNEAAQQALNVTAALKARVKASEATTATALAVAAGVLIESC